MFYLATVDWPQYRGPVEWRKGRVSRETDGQFHVKHPAAAVGLGDPPAPARRLDHQVVQVARGDTRDTRRLGERRRPDAIELLPRLGREALQVEVGKVAWQRERRELRQPRGGLALACEIAVVLELDLRTRDGVGLGRERHARGGQEGAQRRGGPAP